MSNQKRPFRNKILYRISECKGFLSTWKMGNKKGRHQSLGKIYLEGLILPSTLKKTAGGVWQNDASHQNEKPRNSSQS